MNAITNAPRRDLTSQALELADTVGPVFPLRTNKSPTTENGFHDASFLPDVVTRMFADPASAMVGVVTGSISGILVVDVDPPVGTEWFLQNQHRLPKTRTHTTRRGGHHLLFNHREGVGCSQGSLAPGVDVRGDGGYIVWWPATGAPITDHAPIADAPQWLIDDILTAQGGIRSESKAPLRPGDLAPTSAKHVLELLGGMPNPPEATRDDYIAVNMAVQGAIRGGLATDVLTDEDADEIKDAAADWSSRWEGPNPSDFEAERNKWDSDWSRRDNDLSGWPQLLNHARRLGVDVTPFRDAMAVAGLDPLPPEDDAYVPPRGAVGAAGTKKPRIRMMSLAEVETQPDPNWIVKGLVPERGLVIVCGAAKSFKTFLVLSMGLHIAAGRDWFGNAVEQGGVVYICGEGAGGLKQRVKSARAHYGIPADIPFWTVPAAVHFHDPAAVGELISSIRETAGGQPVRMVVVDTLARAMPGIDENSAGDVGRVIAACDQIKEALDCTVMPLHHTGKDPAKGMRGSSALDGAVDTLLSVTRNKTVPASNSVQLATVYQKDGEEGLPMFFDMQTVAAGDRTSLVPVLRAGAPPATERLTAQQQAAVDVLSGLLAECDTGFADEATWRQRCVDGRSVSASDNEKTRKEAFKTAFETLVRKGHVVAEGGTVRHRSSQGGEAEQAEPFDLRLLGRGLVGAVEATTLLG